jgi:hypothetical protein
MIFAVAKHHRHDHHVHEHHSHAHHQHAHHQKDEPKSKLRKLAVPITLIVILAYAAEWAVRFPRTVPANLAAGIAIAAAAASLWILHPRKGR